MAKTAKKKMTPQEKAAMDAKRKAALQAWRDSLPKDENGKPIYPKKAAPEKRLSDKKKKLEELMEQLKSLQEEIAVLDGQVNRKEKKNLMNEFTVEELRAFKAAKQAKLS